MKKYMILAMLAVASFTFNACSNDDIEISGNTVVTVSPKSVITPFIGNQVTNELLSFDSNSFRLRTRVLVYNEDGMLVEQVTENLQNYEATLRKELNLSFGVNYTMITITDVFDANSASESSEYWHMSGESNISQLRLEYVKKNVQTDGFVRKNGILGIGKDVVKIEKGGSEINLSPKPAGSLLRLSYEGIKSMSDITQLGATTDWIPGYVTFDREGNHTLVAAEPGYKVTGNYTYIDLFNTTTATSSSRISYYFAFPSAQSKNYFRTVYYVGNSGTLKSPIEASLVEGGEYELSIDLSSAADIRSVVPTLRKVN